MGSTLRLSYAAAQLCETGHFRSNLVSLMIFVVHTNLNVLKFANMADDLVDYAFDQDLSAERKRWIAHMLNFVD
eukprot:3406756-Prorocentrum_lima.AAC.1